MLDFGSCLNVLEIVKQIEGTLGRGQFILEGTLDEVDDSRVDAIDTLLELLKQLIPAHLVGLVEHVLVEGLQLGQLIDNLLLLLLDEPSTSSDGL